MNGIFHEEKVIITKVVGGNISILANSVSVMYLTEALCLHNNMWFFLKVHAFYTHKMLLKQQYINICKSNSTEIYRCLDLLRLLSRLF